MSPTLLNPLVHFIGVKKKRKIEKKETFRVFNGLLTAKSSGQSQCGPGGLGVGDSTQCLDLQFDGSSGL